jgi:hydroxymethylpyrimidine/phosphomethylpyrimidine kinase
VDAVKIGMVSITETIRTIAETLGRYPLKHVVLDPVMVSKSGFDLLQPDARAALIQWLLPLASVVTPNLLEAEVIADQSIHSVDDMIQAAQAIRTFGPQYVLVKGGHLDGDPVDVLFDGAQTTFYPSPRVQTKNTHGTGCTLSSAIAALLAKGCSIQEAVQGAKDYITTAIEQSFSIGCGVGPVHHFHRFFPKGE